VFAENEIVSPTDGEALDAVHKKLHSRNSKLDAVHKIGSCGPSNDLSITTGALNHPKHAS
jgi:hypothetical protein